MYKKERGGRKQMMAELKEGWLTLNVQEPFLTCQVLDVFWGHVSEYLKNQLPKK